MSDIGKLYGIGVGLMTVAIATSSLSGAVFFLGCVAVVTSVILFARKDFL